MNFQTAAIVGSATALLSFLAGLIGGVPFFDIVLRALFWGAFGFGGSLGIEALLHRLVPEVFVSGPEGSPVAETSPDRAVNIVLDEDPLPQRGGFVEEVDDEDQAAPTADSAVFGGVPPMTRETPQGSDSAEPMAAGDSDEEMPEIGSFLDAFKPSSGEEEQEGGEPSYGEYTPVEPERHSSQEVTMDGEDQDPVVLAKAVQTIMKRDA